jgi:hypothetical protein
MRRFVLVVLLGAALAEAQPLRLHPANPHYFEYRGRPAILITSAEHYGAVLNLDFDYVRYLEELRSNNLNHTRTFAGAYREVPGTFGIAGNTLAPQSARFICPWPRSAEPGATDGLNKFDLEKWDPAYFTRLKDFMRQAFKRGVVVELNLFCPMYEDKLWEISPLNAKNNVNGAGAVGRKEVLTLKDSRLLAVQDAMVKKIASELREFDNLYYEICNEPYATDVTGEWEAHIARTIREADGGRHLISQNIANGSKKVEGPNPLVSIFNFHYSRPPNAVTMNYSLNKAIGMNETGFDGAADAVYRIQGWDFLVAGGALYSNLDYSFIAGREDGTFAYPPSQPGGGTKALRSQLKILRDFLCGFHFVRMAPAPQALQSVEPQGASARVLAEPGKAYAIYIHHGREVSRARPRYQVDSGPHEAKLALNLPAGSYRATWVNTKTGQASREEFSHRGGEKTLASPSYTEDIALRLMVK